MIVFYIDFHTARGAESEGFNGNTDYDEFTQMLGRDNGGEWVFVNGSTNHFQHIPYGRFTNRPLKRVVGDADPYKKREGTETLPYKRREGVSPPVRLFEFNRFYINVNRYRAFFS